MQLRAGSPVAHMSAASGMRQDGAVTDSSPSPEILLGARGRSSARALVLVGSLVLALAVGILWLRSSQGISASAWRDDEVGPDDLAG